MIRDTKPRRAGAALVATVVATLALISARPASAVVYSGPPNLKLTVDLVTAGSGKHGFTTQKLFGFMYGSAMPTEAKRLTHEFGPAPVGTFFTLMDFTVADVLRMVKRDKVALPAASEPLEMDRFDQQLRRAGIDPAGKYDVGYMIENLIGHKYHKELMHDLYVHYPAQTVSSFHIVLARVVLDTKSVAPLTEEQ